MVTKEDFGKLILRLGIGILMLFHGIFKVNNGFGFIETMLQAKGLPSFIWLGVPISEIVAPVLIILGFFTRISSILIAFTMVMTFYLVYGTGGFELSAQGGGPMAELNILYFAASLALFFLGSGRFSVYQGKNAWLK